MSDRAVMRREADIAFGMVPVAQHEDIVRECDRYRVALEQIAGGEARSMIEVWRIARRALVAPSETSGQEEPR